MTTCKVSFVIPAKNEEKSIGGIVERLVARYPNFEVLVVNDGSNDKTAANAEEMGARVVSHPYSKGNGAAIKTGSRKAKGEILVFMDADGQHDTNDIQKLLNKIDEGFDLVVGAREVDTHASWFRKYANLFYNRLASAMTGHKIEDLTSGFRAAKASYFKKFLYLLPNGFSYPTTSTMAFFRSGYSVAYVSIKARQREGKSHIKLFKDGTRFFVIILKVGALFSPMRLFLPVSAALFCVGLFYYGYTYINYSRFTNMSALMFVSSIITFLIGIISEQISSLHYRGVDEGSAIDDGK